MILVDTSVWIRFLAGKAPYSAELERLLGIGVVAGHELVFGELLMGDNGGRSELLSAYSLIQQTRTMPHRDVLEFVYARRLQGRGMGWIDTHLLASAVVAKCKLWTADKRLSAVANELGVGYIPAS